MSGKTSTRLPGSPSKRMTYQETSEDDGAQDSTPLLGPPKMTRTDSVTVDVLDSDSTRILPETANDDDDTSSLNSHDEPHFGSAEIVRDIVIGLSDGLTVPFALAAGLATLNNSRLVVTAGLAEIVAGSISMGLGGFLAGLSEIEHYDSERKREEFEVDSMPHREEHEIVEIFEPYGLTRKDLEPMLRVLKANKGAWVDFMMKFELSLERPSHMRSWISALTIGLSYLFGGLIPLFPYVFIQETTKALLFSTALTLLALFVFGFVKARLLGTPRPLASALQMAVVGGAAAGCAYAIANAIPQPML